MKLERGACARKGASLPGAAYFPSASAFAPALARLASGLPCLATKPFRGPAPCSGARMPRYLRDGALGIGTWPLRRPFRIIGNGGGYILRDEGTATPPRKPCRDGPVRGRRRGRGGAALLRPEEREERLGEKKRPAQVDREDPVPFPLGDLACRRAREDRGVVDKHVQPAELPYDRTYETEKPLRAQQVEGEGPPADFPGEGTGLHTRGAVGERDGEPIAGEGAGDRRADAPGSPGDQRDLPRPGAHFSSMNFSFGAPQMGQGSGGSSPW